MTRMLSTKTLLAVPLFWLCSFLACSNDAPAPAGTSSAGHAAPPILAAGGPASTAASTPAAPTSASTTAASPSATATPATTSTAKPPAAGGGGSAASAAGGGSKSTATAGSGSSPSGGAAGASGDAGADDPFGLGGDPSDPSTANNPPPAGMCENLFCFDVFDCAIFHIDEAAVCNFTDCVDFVCKQ